MLAGKETINFVAIKMLLNLDLENYVCLIVYKAIDNTYLGIHIGTYHYM